MKLTITQANKIKAIILEKIHGEEFWTKEMYTNVLSEIERVINLLDINSQVSQSSIIEIVNEYIISIYDSPKSYWDAWRNGTEQKPAELVKRTAYSALVNKQATCFGYEQATRMLLECVV